MHKMVLAALAVVCVASAHTTVGAQGWIMPRPCRPLPDVPCGRIVPSTVERVSSVVKAELVGTVVRYEVTEQFVNRGSGLAEADYMFPLPEGAAFQGLQLSVNGQMISGESMDATQARQIYENIVRQQRDPALVEWMGYGLLRARIFPLPHGEQKTVVIRYQAVARREGDALRVDYSRGSAPRTPGWLATPMRRQGGPSGHGRDDDDVMRGEQGFTLRVPSDARYGAPFSPTHRVSVRDVRGGREVVLSGEGNDFTVLIPMRRPSEMAITVLPYAPRRDDGFTMITITPPATAVRATPRDVTVVIDVSGSMSGQKIEQAKSAAKRVLNTLRPTDRFRVIDFSTEVHTFRDDYVEATSEMTSRAQRYIDALNADGGTNIDGALDEALRPTSATGRLPLVLFITDGEPTVGVSDPATIVSHTAQWRGRARVFTFGLGADVNASLLEQLALDGRGTAQFVRPEGSVERAVSLVASRLSTPVLTDVRVTAQGVTLSKWSPPAPPDLFAGQDLVLFARYDGHGDGRVIVQGTSPSGPVRTEVRVDFPQQDNENAFVARLWAARRIGYLSAEKRKHEGSTEFDDEIKSLGETYGIPTEFSSYLVQEPQMIQDRRVSNGLMVGAGAGAPAPSAMAMRKQAFDMAKVASSQRDAASLAAVATTAAEASQGLADDASGGSVTTRQIGARTFVLRDSVWTDARPQGKLPVMHVAPYSDAYFALIAAVPELGTPCALGSRVVIVGRGVVLDITPKGATTLSVKQVAVFRQQW